ncbi:hypothetical protein HYT26_03535 [Candidatus Pacearchaeota archaeon]|nr:hypothetical protein [Candidatus Pacearchaeota archaeon]
MNSKLIIFFISFLLILSAVQFADALTISSVDVSPSEIAPGGTAEITIDLKNNFDRTLSDIEIYLDFSSENLPLAPYGSGAEMSIDELRSEKSKTLIFSVIALSDAKPGVYKIPVMIKYTDNRTEVKKPSLISLSVNAKPALYITAEDSILIKGQSNTLSIKIINNGLSDVKLLTIKLNDVIGTDMLSQQEIYVGELSSDNFDSAEFKIFVSDNAPGVLNLPVELKYRDAANNELKETKSLGINAYSKEEAISLGLIKRSNTFAIIITIAVLILAYILYRIIRKRRRQKAARQV